MTTYLTTNRNGLRDNNGIYRTIYHLFRTKKHDLDAISRKKLSPFAWGGRGRKFKSCHSDQKSVRMHNSCGFFLLVFVYIQHISGLFAFYNLFSTYKVHTTKGMYTIYQRYVLNQCTKSEKALYIKGFRLFTSTFREGRGFNLRPLLKFP